MQSFPGEISPLGNIGDTPARLDHFSESIEVAFGVIIFACSVEVLRGEPRLERALLIILFLI
jgi:hypothetical protein